MVAKMGLVTDHFLPRSGNTILQPHPLVANSSREGNDEYHNTVYDEEEVHGAPMPNSASMETAGETKDSMIFIRTGSLQFLNLPRELRDKVYKYMLRPKMCLKDLTGKTSDWFNPAILCTNRQIYSEAASTIYNEQIGVVVDLEMARGKNGLRKLPWKSQFRRCLIDLNLSDPRLKLSWSTEHTYDKEKIISAMIGITVEDIYKTRFLEELHLSFRGTTDLTETHTYGLFPMSDQHYLNLYCFPDMIKGCFENVPGLKKIVVEGELDEAYIADLVEYIDNGLVDTAPPVNIIQEGKCIICTLPDRVDLSE